MSQNTEASMQLTTMTNVTDAINHAVRSRQNLKDVLIELRGGGVSPEMLKNALGSLVDDQQIRDAIKLSSGPDYMKSFDALDPKRRAEELEAWRVMAAVKRSKEWLDAEEATEKSTAEKSEHASKLGAALDKAHTFEEKVHAFEDHFAAGGAIWEVAQALGMSSEQAKKIKEREKELSEEWGRKHQGEREKVATELQRRGKNREEAERLAKEREEALRTRDVVQTLEREGQFNGLEPQTVAAIKRAAEKNANERSFAVGDLVESPSQSRQVGLATGAASKEDVGVAKFGEKAGVRDGRGMTASDDEFASLGEPAPAVASVDIKGKLASMRNAEAPASASKGPSLA